MVSIILPNLNTPIEFLHERVDSIINQTNNNWECIVIDGFSKNGSWEYITKKIETDNRFKCYQKPALGIYDAWNEGIKQAKGEYIYIATSDDLFSADFLDKMVAILDKYIDCDIAHCCINIIDEQGHPTPSQWRNWEKVQFYGNHITKYHKRLAPHDAIVHFGWSTVYTSIVQLLIRKRVFDEIGLFSTRYGSIADFEWGLRVSLKVNLIHVPLYLASWRKHNKQATQDEFINSPEFYDSLIQMAKNTLTYKSGKVTALSHSSELYFNYLFKQFSLSTKVQKIRCLMQYFATNPLLVIKIILYRLFYVKFDPTVFIKQQLSKQQLLGHIVDITDN